jgi:hypothetical protein
VNLKTASYVRNYYNDNTPLDWGSVQKQSRLY